jgi:hypothetical protein
VCAEIRADFLVVMDTCCSCQGRGEGLDEKCGCRWIRWFRKVHNHYSIHSSMSFWVLHYIFASCIVLLFTGSLVNISKIPPLLIRQILIIIQPLHNPILPLHRVRSLMKLVLRPTLHRGCGVDAITSLVFADIPVSEEKGGEDGKYHSY